MATSSAATKTSALRKKTSVSKKKTTYSAAQAVPPTITIPVPAGQWDAFVDFYKEQLHVDPNPSTTTEAVFTSPDSIIRLVPETTMGVAKFTKAVCFTPKVAGDVDVIFRSFPRGYDSSEQPVEVIFIPTGGGPLTMGRMASVTYRNKADKDYAADGVAPSAELMMSVIYNPNM